MVHSQSGAYGLDLVRARAAKMLATNPSLSERQ
jgi:hypothetical protein